MRFAGMLTAMETLPLEFITTILLWIVGIAFIFQMAKRERQALAELRYSRITRGPSEIADPHKLNHR